MLPASTSVSTPERSPTRSPQWRCSRFPSGRITIRPVIHRQARQSLLGIDGRQDHHGDVHQLQADLAAQRNDRPISGQREAAVGENSGLSLETRTHADASELYFTSTSAAERSVALRDPAARATRSTEALPSWRLAGAAAAGRDGWPPRGPGKGRRRCVGFRSLSGRKGRQRRLGQTHRQFRGPHRCRPVCPPVWPPRGRRRRRTHCFGGKVLPESPPWRPAPLCPPVRRQATPSYRPRRRRWMAWPSLATEPRLFPSSTEGRWASSFVPDPCFPKYTRNACRHKPR